MRPVETRKRMRILNRLRSRVTPGTILATIALCAAVGGGYATAFSGSGTVQKGALLNLPGSPTVVRSLTGIGSINAACADIGSADSPAVSFQNTSGETLSVEMIGIDEDLDFGPLGTGSGVNVDNDVAGRNAMRVHITPEDGTKAPQADIRITAVDTNNCTTSSVAVLATNTQE